MRLPPRTSLAALAALAYAGIWSYGFASDDVGLVDRLMRHGWQGIAAYLSPRTGVIGSGFYRPAWVLSIAGNYALWGTWPGGYHLTSLLLFAGSVVLLGDVVRRTTGDARAAWWAAALFAVHPVDTLAVVWISGGTDLHAVFGMLAALAAASRWWERRERRWLVAALGAAVFALGSKEIAYVLPALAMVTEWTRLRRVGCARPFREALRESAPFWVLTLVWGGTVLALSAETTRYAWLVSPREAIVNWAAALVLVALPVDYELLIRFFAARPALLAAGAALTGLAALGLAWGARRNTLLRWGVLWIALAIALCYRLTMRWYLLLGAAGMCIFLAGLVRSVEARNGRALGTVLGAMLLVTFAAGLVRERMKWAEADRFAKSALVTLVVEAGRPPVPERVILTASPAKLRRMGVFGGYTESFLRVAGGPPVELCVLSRVALDRESAAVRCTRVDSSRVRLDIAPGDGAFLVGDDLAALNRRGYLVDADARRIRFATDLGPATVTAVDGDNRPVALEVALVGPMPASTRWLTLDGGRFVPLEPTP